MKKQITVALLGLALVFASAATASARAGVAMRIHVPFDFVAGGRQLKAGGYTVRRVRTDAEGALIIRSLDGRQAAVVITNAGGATPARAAMSFRRYGGRYFLAEVSIPGTASVRELPKAGAERQAERESVEEAKAGGEVKTAGGEVKTVTIVGGLQ